MKLSYAQFVKQYQATSKADDNFNPAPVSVMKQYDEDGQPFYENHIVTADYDTQEKAVELPKFIKISNLKPGELPFMKLRSPQVL